MRPSGNSTDLLAQNAQATLARAELSLLAHKRLGSAGASCYVIEAI